LSSRDRKRLLVSVALGVLLGLVAVSAFMRWQENSVDASQARAWRAQTSLTEPCAEKSPYLAALRQLPDAPRPITSEELRQAIRDKTRHDVSSNTRYPSRELGTEILWSLNLRKLFEGAPGSALSVRVTAKQDQGSYWREELRLSDPVVGEFSMLLLVPKAAQPVPVVVGLHGHGNTSSGVDFARAFRMDDLVDRGIAVAAPTFRAMCADETENEVTRAYLARGYCFIGMRVYETRLCLAYLRSRPDLAPEQIGLIGHSGGSAIGNLVIRLERGIRAYVPDMTSEYNATRGNLFLDEMCPELSPYASAIADFDTARMTVLPMPYGFKAPVGGSDLLPEVFSFFERRLLAD